MKNRTLLIAIAIVAGAALLGGIVAVIMMLLAPEQSSSPNQQSSNFKQGTVSTLSGGTSSYRNLKGLTIRVNQIDTCHPTQISAYVSVSSEQGDVNKNFGKNDVSVYLDGQKVANFDFSSTASKKLPLANMLVIDHSGSMQGAAMESAKGAAASYIDKLGDNDQVGLIQFDTSVETLAAMTTDKTSVKAKIGQIAARGDTAIYDALAESIGAVPNCGRKQITVLSDGGDTASKSSNEQAVIAAANKSNMPIFAVGIQGSTFDPTSIRAIADQTGGQYLEANNPAEIASIYDKIDGQLKGQFVANFTTGLKKDGMTHTLKIISNVEGSETGSERHFIY
ncbi:MAG: VWA domain-containing protein [Candidatus Saccharibacteria bacterium]|nr:VWA domain-containing protein [Candidatus Saccharibacteria bacterium]